MYFSFNQINEMKSNLLAERQKQSETSSQLGDRHTFKSKTDKVDNPMERDDKLKISSSANPFAVTAESSKQERKSSRCVEIALFTPESPPHCEGNESIRTLYAIVSNTDAKVLHSIRQPTSLQS